MATAKEWIATAEKQLAKAGIPTARLDAELLLTHTMRQPRTWLHSHDDEELDVRTLDIVNARLDLRLDRVPIAYIIGHKEFYGYGFKVTPSTLIPRPESEALIDLLDIAVPSNLSLIAEKPLKLVDVGTGSGALGIVAKLRHPELDVTLVDMSRHALGVAERNAEAHHVDVDFLVSNLLDSYPYSPDIVIANPPYVDEEWERSPETDHEPEMALFAADGGLALIRALIHQTKYKLAQNGHLILEADPEQHAAIKKEASASGLVLLETKDYGLLFQKLK